MCFYGVILCGYSIYQNLTNVNELDIGIIQNLFENKYNGNVFVVKYCKAIYKAIKYLT